MPGKSVYANFGRLLALALLCGGAIGVTGCSTGEPTAAPARPTATVEAVRPHPTRPPRPTPTEVSVVVPDTPTPEQSGFDGGFFDATATPVEDGGFFGATATPEDGGFFSNTPTPDEGGGFFDDTPTPETDTTEYAFYQAPEGGWSLEYPSDWTVDVEEPNYQFSNAVGDAFVQETYAPLDSSMANEDLAQIASEQFQANFENYVESGQVEQSDGSYRIDFKFDASDGADTVQWDAQAFVEAHQQHVYMLMLATTEDAYEAGTYDEIIGHIIDSYRVPSE